MVLSLELFIEKLSIVIDFPLSKKTNLDIKITHIKVLKKRKVHSTRNLFLFLLSLVNIKIENNWFEKPYSK